MYKTILVSLSLLILSLTVAAQDFSSIESLSSLKNISKPAQSASITPSTPIEYPVDENEYRVGPGDIIQIVVGNREESTFNNLKISPEGSLSIPSVGSVDLTGMTLAKAKSEITDLVKSKYLDDNIEITLIDVRAFKVTVSGAVNSPGLVIVTAGDRVSDAIYMAGGFEMENPPENLQKKPTARTNPNAQQTQKPETSELEIEFTNPQEKDREIVASKRNITVKRRTGEVLNADYLKYSLIGDLDANPVLVDGDVVTISSLKEGLGQVSIFGAVKNPETYEYLPGDRVKDILNMAHGFTIDADSSQIELVRFTNHASATKKISLLLDTPERKKESLNFMLKPDDRLFVQQIPNYHSKRTVEIKGEVLYPNKYALDDTVRRLKDVVKLAGGFTSSASLKNAYIIRRALENVQDPEFIRLQNMMVADMTEMERDYFKVKSRERTGQMGIDFIQVFEQNDEQQNILLRDQDLIVIPTKDLTVNVAGQVINPGLIPFENSKKLEYYIAEAGGYNYNAKKSKVHIIKAKTGEWLRPGRKVSIEVGDTIFVPEKGEIDWWELTRDLVAVGYQLATIYLVIDRTK